MNKLWTSVFASVPLAINDNNFGKHPAEDFRGVFKVLIRNMMMIGGAEGIAPGGKLCEMKHELLD